MRHIQWLQRDMKSLRQKLGETTDGKDREILILKIKTLSLRIKNNALKCQVNYLKEGLRRACKRFHIRYAELLGDMEKINGEFFRKKKSFRNHN